MSPAVHNVPAPAAADLVLTDDTPDTPEPKALSHGARLCLQAIRQSRAGRGGWREVGINRLCAVLRRKPRTVRRYLRELEAHGLLQTRKHSRAYDGTRWRSTSCQRYLPAGRKVIRAVDKGKSPGQTDGTRLAGRPLTGTGGGPSAQPPRALPLIECANPDCRAPFRGPGPTLCLPCRA